VGALWIPGLPVWDAAPARMKPMHSHAPPEVRWGSRRAHASVVSAVTAAPASAGGEWFLVPATCLV
jgi:hypothetical protein